MSPDPLRPPPRVAALTLPAAALPAGDDWLAPAEAARLAALRLPKRREEWRLGRYAAKRLLAALLPEPVPLAALAVLAAPDGAPEAFLRGAPLGWALSLSHRAGLAFCAAATSGAALGCDVEYVEPRSDAFVADYLTAAEQAMLAAAPAAERPLLANLVWSAKESALKALRQGLRLDTREVEVLLPVGVPDEGPGWRALAVRCGAREMAGWWRRKGEHLLTLVAEPACPPPRVVATG